MLRLHHNGFHLFDRVQQLEPLLSSATAAVLFRVLSKPPFQQAVRSRRIRHTFPAECGCGAFPSLRFAPPPPTVCLPLTKTLMLFLHDTGSCLSKVADSEKVSLGPGPRRGHADDDDAQCRSC
eukprot:3553102-Rhodomonas_salina.1